MTPQDSVPTVPPTTSFSLPENNSNGRMEGLSFSREQ
jgi:hypothetical protein